MSSQEPKRAQELSSISDSRASLLIVDAEGVRRAPLAISDAQLHAESSEKTQTDVLNSWLPIYPPVVVAGVGHEDVNRVWCAATSAVESI